MSFSSNVKYYVMGFLSDGSPSIRTFANTKLVEKNDTKYITDLKNSIYKQAEASEPQVKLAIVEIINAEDYNLYLQNYVRDMKTGRPIPYVPPEPTAEEIQKSNLAELDANYSTQLNELKDQIIVAATVDQDEEYANELRQQRQELQDEYVQKRGEL